MFELLVIEKLMKAW